MHELGLCEAIVEAIAARAGSREVAKVRVQVGRLHHVHPEAFEQSFALAAAGTVAQGARAELVVLPVTGSCQACAAPFEADELPLACPACGAVSIDVSGGSELLLESIQYRPAP